MPSRVSSALQLMLRATRGASSVARNLYYKAIGVEISGYAWLRRVEIPQNFSDISLADGVALDTGVVLLAVGPSTGKKKITIGESTYVNRNSFIDAAEEIRIGRNVGIGPLCYITDHDHGTEAGKLFSVQSLISDTTTICDGVWLGAGVIVLRGVTIGMNTVVAAGSVVARDLPPDVIAGGRPAAAIKKR